jgi:hypothetical protein
LRFVDGLDEEFDELLSALDALKRTVYLFVGGRHGAISRLWQKCASRGRRTRKQAPGPASLTGHVSPYVRVSSRSHKRLRCKAGYEHCGYRDKFFSRQNYRTHTGYVSLLWAF